MQPHEGPKRDRNADERGRQRSLTWRLSLVVLGLAGLLTVLLVQRWL